MKIMVDPKKCHGSGRCIKACPQDAIKLSHNCAVIDEDKCDLDGICIPVCPHSAIYMED